MQKLWKIAALLLFFGSVGTLRADSPDPADAVTATPSTAMQVKATEVLQQAETDYRYVLYLQSQARRKNDVIKLNCVNDKLVQIKAEMNVGDTANEQLQIAISSKSADSNSAFDQLTQVGTNISKLRQDAAACLGESELVKQESGGTFSHPVFPDDPTVIPFATYVEPPAYASPFN